MRRFIACIADAQHQRVIKVPAYPFLSTLGLYARNQVWDEWKQLRNICHLHAAHGFRNVVLRSRISCGWRPVLTHTMSLETLKPSFLRKIKLFLAYFEGSRSPFPDEPREVCSGIAYAPYIDWYIHQDIFNFLPPQRRCHGAEDDTQKYKNMNRKSPRTLNILVISPRTPYTGSQQCSG